MAASTPVPIATARRRARTSAVLAGAVLAAATGLLTAGCAGSAAPASSSAGTAPLPAPAEVPAAGRPAAGVAGLTALPASQAIVYTASMTVRASDVSAAAARAARYANTVGGYVSSQSTHADRAHPAQASVSIQLKIPVAAFPAALAALSRQLGTRISLSEQARDVTQAVADVSSRVASAQAAIAQLRRLLTRAGSVSSLLSVQDQINQQEANLEALLAQQRALAHETSYATLSLLLVSPPAAAHRQASAPPAGFLGGLAAGWRALLLALSWLVTAAGVVLPFAGILALAGLAGYQGWRRLGRHRARPAGGSSP